MKLILINIGATIGGLTSQMKYWFNVAAVGSNGKSPEALQQQKSLREIATIAT